MVVQPININMSEADKFHARCVQQAADLHERVNAIEQFSVPCKQFDGRTVLSAEHFEMSVLSSIAHLAMYGVVFNRFEDALSTVSLYEQVSGNPPLDEPELPKSVGTCIYAVVGRAPAHIGARTEAFVSPELPFSPLTHFADRGLRLECDDDAPHVVPHWVNVRARFDCIANPVFWCETQFVLGLPLVVVHDRVQPTVHVHSCKGRCAFGREGTLRAGHGTCSLRAVIDRVSLQTFENDPRRLPTADGAHMERNPVRRLVELPPWDVTLRVSCDEHVDTVVVYSLRVPLP